MKELDRESLRWFRGFDATDQLLEGTDVVHVADREGDNYELIAQAVKASQRFVIRARVLDRKVEYTDGDVDALKTVVEGARGALNREVPLPARKSGAFRLSSHPERAARMAKLEFSATRAILRRPKYQDKTLLADVELNIVKSLRTYYACRRNPDRVGALHNGADRDGGGYRDDRGHLSRALAHRGVQ